MADIRLSPLRVLDKAKIREQGILDQVTDDVSSFIRSVLSDPNRKYFTASFFELGKELVFGILGLDGYSEKNRSASSVMYFSDKVVTEDGERSIPEEYFVSAYDSLLRYAFFDLSIHRVSAMIPVTDEPASRVLLSCNMRQEALLDEALFVDGAFCESALFSQLDSEYPNYSVGFVP